MWSAAETRARRAANPLRVSMESRITLTRPNPGTDRTGSEIPANCAGNSCQSCQSPTLAKLAAHGAEELAVGAGLAQLVQQQLHGLYGRKRIEHLAEDPHAVQFVLGQEKLFLAGTALVDVDGGEGAP